MEHSLLRVLGMKACPNARCPHRLQHGTPAPYLATSVLCRHCAGPVVAIEDLARAERAAAKTVPSANRRQPISEGILFFLGLAGVVVPHFLAQLVGNIAYALPLVAVVYVISRLSRSPRRDTFDTTFVRAVSPEPRTLG